MPKSAPVVRIAHRSAELKPDFHSRISPIADDIFRQRKTSR